MRYCELFSDQTGCHFIDLEGDFVLLSGELATEAMEEAFHEHPEIASLPHPTMESTTTFDDLITDPKHGRRQFSEKHFAALNSHPALKIDRKHTVWDLHDQARKIHPLVRLTNVY